MIIIMMIMKMKMKIGMNHKTSDDQKSKEEW